MADFMDTALNYQHGIRIAPSSKWVMTNGTIQMDVCTVCAQPYREGHIDCTCPSNHPERCDRLTYDQLGEHLRRIAGDNADIATKAMSQLAEAQEMLVDLATALEVLQGAFSLANDYENDIPTAASNRVSARKLAREAIDTATTLIETQKGVKLYE